MRVSWLKLDVCMQLICGIVMSVSGSPDPYYSYDYGPYVGSRDRSDVAACRSDGRTSDSVDPAHRRPTASIRCFSCRTDVYSESFWNRKYGSLMQLPLSATLFCQADIFDRRHVRDKVCESGCVSLRTNALLDDHQFQAMFYRGCESDLRHFNHSTLDYVRQRRCAYVSYGHLFAGGNSGAASPSTTVYACACRRSLCNRGAATIHTHPQLLQFTQRTVVLIVCVLCACCFILRDHFAVN